MGEAVVIDRTRPGIAVLTLNRPERLNAMNYDLVRGIYDALDELAEDRACRVIVLTGAGRGFCAGLDLTEGASPPSTKGMGRAQAGMTVQKMIAGLVPKMRAAPQPIIAAVNGAASGGGLALALASDVRIAAASARFNVAFVRVGLSGCDIGVSWMLPRLIGASRAFDLIVTGRTVDADTAEHLGIVSQVFDDDGFLDTALGVAEGIAAYTGIGLRMTKEVMWANLDTPNMAACIALENRNQEIAGKSPEVQEFMRAYSGRVTG